MIAAQIGKAKVRLDFNPGIQYMCSNSSFRRSHHYVSSVTEQTLV